MSLTLKQKSNFDGWPKAKEVIELTGAKTGQLTMHDRRTLNLLFEHAHDHGGLAEDVEHEIALMDIRGTHKGGERIRESLRRLVGITVEISTTVNGKPKIIHTHLLDFTESDLNEDDPTATVRYGLPKKLRKALKGSTQWGRIKAEIVMAMTSKYAISLYELVQLRSGLSQKFHEDFDLERFRELMGVPSGKLLRAPDLIRRVVRPAELEVNGLSDFSVKLGPLRQGGADRGKLIGIRMSWWRKNADEYRVALKERKNVKIGRMARLKGEVEEIETQIKELS